VAAARPYRELGLSSIMVSWELEEEYGCVGRGVAGQLAIIALVARRRLDVYNKKGAPRVAVAAALGGRGWKEHLEVLILWVAVVGHALIGLAVLSALALYIVGLL